MYRVAIRLGCRLQLADGLAALAAAPVVAVIQIWPVRSMVATDAECAERDHEATGRVIERLQAQRVLRAGGQTVERFGLLDDALHELQRASASAVDAARRTVADQACTEPQCRLVQSTGPRSQSLVCRCGALWPCARLAVLS